MEVDMPRASAIVSRDGVGRHVTHDADVAAAAGRPWGCETEEDRKLLEAQDVAMEAAARGEERRRNPELYRISDEEARRIDAEAAARREREWATGPQEYRLSDASSVVGRAWAEYSGAVASRLAMGADMTAAIRGIEMRPLDPSGLAAALGDAVFGKGPLESLAGAVRDDARLQAAQRWADSLKVDVPSHGPVGMVVPFQGGPSGSHGSFSIDMERLEARLAPPAWWRRLLARLRRQGILRGAAGGASAGTGGVASNPNSE